MKFVLIAVMCLVMFAGCSSKTKVGKSYLSVKYGFQLDAGTDNFDLEVPKDDNETTN